MGNVLFPANVQELKEPAEDGTARILEAQDTAQKQAQKSLEKKACQAQKCKNEINFPVPLAMPRFLHLHYYIGCNIYV